MTARLHPCAAESCGKPIAAHLFMCLPHWRMVPKALQRALRTAWRAWGAVGGGHAGLEDIKGATARLQEARQQCINAVREKEIQRAIRNQQHGDNLDLNAPDRYAGEAPMPD